MANQAMYGVPGAVITATGAVVGGKELLQARRTWKQAKRDGDPQQARKALTMAGEATLPVANFGLAAVPATGAWASWWKTLQGPQPTAIPPPIAERVGDVHDQALSNSVRVNDNDPLAALEMDALISEGPARPRRPEPWRREDTPQSNARNPGLFEDLPVEEARKRLEEIFGTAPPSAVSTAKPPARRTFGTDLSDLDPNRVTFFG